MDVQDNKGNGAAGTDIVRMRELAALLNKASRAYYTDGSEIMSNRNYDSLYDELVMLEKKTGVTLSQSPTIRVGDELLDALPKQKHPVPMLSLDKTKDPAALKMWLNGSAGLLSWKLDGITVALTYANGALQSAVTRGNGIVGEVVTSNARTFKNIPLIVPEKRAFTVRGEAVISYQDFERINADPEIAHEQYKNPRNLCAGSVRQLSSSKAAKRSISFYAFALADSPMHFDYRHRQLEWLESQGFDVVEYVAVKGDSVTDAVHSFESGISGYGLPSDGLVLTLDDIAYATSLGSTAKFPRDSIAFKWGDRMEETTLREIKWSASRTGLLNPVAVFDPVELEGTTVSRASVHNLSTVESLKLAPGDRISVYKANMIIPQVEENLTKKGPQEPPLKCPVCGGPTRIMDENGVRTLNCTNPQCPAKRIKSYVQLVSREGLNIDGLSEATLEKLVSAGFIHEPADIFKLGAHRDEIAAMEGFGEKSAANIIDACKAASHTTLRRLLYALGIANIGAVNAASLSRHFNGDINALKKADRAELEGIDGIGPLIAEKIWLYFRDEKNMAALDGLLGVINIKKEEADGNDGRLSGMTFVITGTLAHFANRDSAKELIERAGGRVSGSVSSRTDYLINNDKASSSSKNKKAKELGIPVISEEELLAMLE